jgi:cobalt transporter subunit CbtB
MPTPASPAAPGPLSVARVRTVRAALPPLLAILLGLLIVGTAGFADQGVIHSAGHDTRHSNAFPCH